jgi:hypothetical protein
MMLPFLHKICGREECAAVVTRHHKLEIVAFTDGVCVYFPAHSTGPVIQVVVIPGHPRLLCFRAKQILVSLVRNHVTAV